MYRLRSIIRSISGLYCKVLLLRSTCTDRGASLGYIWSVVYGIAIEEHVYR